MEVIKIGEVDSTNSYLEREGVKLKAPVMVIAERQSSGRGQRGNYWESASGKNLTFSILFCPESFRAVEQFSISEATSLAVVDFLKLHGAEAKVKWPNDIYVGDRKICGILIQHSLMGSNISQSILGVGININQTEFVSDAPNPVSLRQLTGETYILESLTAEIAECMESRLRQIYGMRHRMALHEEFMCNLWRGDGSFYPFCDTASGENFNAAIDGIDLEGVMTLRLKDQSARSYRFKEVSFLL